MAEQLTRQQLYDRIRQSSKDEYILSEMKRLGFWKSDEAQPCISEQLIYQEADLYKELNELTQKQRKFENQQAMLTEMRKARLKESKQKQAETKLRNEQKRLDKAAKWKIAKEQNIIYLGDDVSGGLNDIQADAAKLEKFGLPNFESPLNLATAMNLSIGKLRFLAYQRKVSQVSHYKRFYLPKKTGGKRLISAPMPLLKSAQYWILEHILYKINPTNSAHGFVPTRSILTNAQHHIGKDVVINLDLKDFFPSLTYKRVKGFYQSIGYSQQIATILALLSTEPDVEMLAIDGKTYYVSTSERKLPQGSPCSPAVTNLICYGLDHRFEGIARKFGFSYTRYADDLTFSGNEHAAKIVGQLLWSVKQIIEDEGFLLHPDKLKVMRKGSKQEVTGIVVNEKLSIDRDELRRFRALIHQIKKKGIENKTWKGNLSLENSMRGYANFVTMVKPEQGQKFNAQLDDIFGSKPSKIKQQPNTSTTPPPSQPSKNDGKDWWKVI